MLGDSEPLEARLLELCHESGALDQAVQDTYEQRMAEAGGVAERIQAREIELKRARGELSTLMTLLKTQDHHQVPQSVYER